ncbi:RES family NAD+ phosphorylase [Bordetella sp. 2513F-2]
MSNPGTSRQASHRLFAAGLFDQLGVVNMHDNVARNIVSIRLSQDLFDDLSDNPADWRLAQQVEDAVKPPPYTDHLPVINRPFEEAEWYSVIQWPFAHWQASRFSAGSHGVWYGSESIETTVYETVHHWYHGLLGDAGFQGEAVVAERRVYEVACDAMLLDFRQVTAAYPDLLHPTDYTLAQAVGARIRHEGHPGLLIQSARRPQGENVAVFTPAVLSNPRHQCFLTYRLEGGKVAVEREPGQVWMAIEP